MNFIGLCIHIRRDIILLNFFWVTKGRLCAILSLSKKAATEIQTAFKVQKVTDLWF